MKLPRSILAVVLGAGASARLAAQAPAQPSAVHLPAPMLQTATFDVSAAFQHHWRAALEPLVFGRFAIGLSGEYTTEPEQPIYGILYPYPQCPINMFCANPASDPGTSYRAWSFNLSARWYPAVLSMGGARQSLGLYVGEFIGYHERTISQPIYYGCPNCYYPPPIDSTSQTFPRPPIDPGRYTQVVHGFEPGVELGVRILPMQHVVIDVGGRFRLATIRNDFYSGVQPGDVDSRLVVAVGLGR